MYQANLKDESGKGVLDRLKGEVWFGISPLQCDNSGAPAAVATLDDSLRTELDGDKRPVEPWSCF